MVHSARSIALLLASFDDALPSWIDWTIKISPQGRPFRPKSMSKTQHKSGRQGRPKCTLSQKPENNPKLELMPEVLVKDQSKHWGQKHKLKPDMLIEDGSTCQSRILTLLLKCKYHDQDHNLISINHWTSQEKSYLFCKIECSHQIFGLSWL